MNWIDTTVGEYCPFIYGKGLPKTKRVQGNFPVYGSNGCVDTHEEPLINSPGIIIGRKGSCGAVHLSEGPFWPIDTSFYLVKESYNELRFTYYLLKTLGLEHMNSDSAVPGLNRENAHGIKIRIPEKLEDREKLGYAISVFDQKIANNTAMNATLEKIAQRIFKSWFIDFDPVKANAESVQFDGLSPEIQALFPNEFEESELGMIPKGWEVTNLGSVSECLDSKRIPLSKIKREQKPGIYPYYGATSLMGFIDEWIFDDIYLLLGEDGSVIKDDKTPFTQYIWGKTWVNNHAHVLKGANGISTEQLMIHVQRANVSEFITGAVQLKINQTNMKRIPFIKASNYINEAFQRIISPLYEKIRLLKDQNDGLIKIRDKLLPRLISGKITIQKAEELLEEAS